MSISGLTSCWIFGPRKHVAELNDCSRPRFDIAGTLNNRQMDRRGLARQLPAMPGRSQHIPTGRDQYRKTFSGRKALSVDFNHGLARISPISADAAVETGQVQCPVKSSTSSPAQSDNLGLTTKAKIQLHRHCGEGGFYATRKHHQK